MKKQVFGLIAALFVCAVLLPVGARATNNVYAILYEDGTLVFQNGNTPEPGRTVTETYPVNLGAVTTDLIADYEPWYNECLSVRVVSFNDRISPVSTALWFNECWNLVQINNIWNLDTSNVTTMCRMFYECTELTVLDVSNFDTANVVDMSSMFYECHSLTALDVSHFNTENVMDMYGMFWNCERLAALDVSHFDTTNVTDIGDMFAGCHSLGTLDVAGFNTANVTNMSSMFCGCSGLTTLNVSNFNTVNVTDMSHMFYDCSGLTTLDMSNFNTANVTDMWCLFSHCSNLTMLDISGFDTANVTNMGAMFSNCSNLQILYASGKFTTASVKSDGSMFLDCTSLVGGNGTTYDENHVNIEYARIDTPSAPGYFTDKSTVYAITAAVPRNRTLSVTLSNPAAATVAVACFDMNGRFLSINLQDAPANVGAVTIPVPTNAKRALVMLWNNARRPLCAAFAADIR